MSSIEMQSISIELSSCMNGTLNLDIGCKYSASMLPSLTFLNVERNMGQNFTYSKCKCSFFPAHASRTKMIKPKLNFVIISKSHLKYISMFICIVAPPIFHIILKGKWEIVKFNEKRKGQYSFDYSTESIVEKMSVIYLYPVISFSAYDGTLS